MDLWQFDTWRTDRPVIFNTLIIEYDLKSAGLSVAKEFSLLPEDYIKDLDNMSKKDRVVSLGLYKRNHPEYSASEKVGLEAARRMFIETNGLDANDIVAIKKDAIFVADYGVKVNTTKFGKHLEFRKKNEYNGFMFVKPLEIYYGVDGELDIKGMDKEVYEEYHKEYFGKFIKGIFAVAENETAWRHFIYRYIRDFYDKYRLDELDYEYYREFNAMSQYAYTGVMKDASVKLITYNARKAGLCLGPEFGRDIDKTYNAGVIISILMAVLSI